MLAKILDSGQDELLKEERRVLTRLQLALVKFDAAAEHRAALEQSIHQLDELFLLVIVGEFNAGKSAFINALVGSPVAQEGVTPTTAQINVLQYGDQPGRQVREDNLHIITAPAPILRDIHIVDTPGTNAIIREHEAITSEFVPRSDLVLFVTSADRPFTETERAFLEQIRGWGKKVVIVINKIDILGGAGEVAEVRTFVADNARALLGFSPEVFPVSARLALRAKQGDPASWAASGFEDLERYIAATLDAPGRVHLKLLNPLGVGAAISERHGTIVRERLGLLKEDFTTLEGVDQQLSVYQEDLTRDFEFRMADIDKILLEMERRGQDYFDETIRIGRVMDLLNRSRIQQGFEQQVVADTPQQIERKVGELVDWLVAADLRQWQAVTTHLAERRRQYQNRIVGEDSGQFHYDRTRMIDAVSREAQRVVESYDKKREAQHAGRQRPERRRRGRGRRRDRARPRRRHHVRRLHGHRRLHRDRAGLAGRRPGVLHPAGQAPEGEERDAREDRGRAEAAVGGAAEAVFDRDPAQRRPHSREHRPIQPVHPRRGEQAEGSGCGADRDQRRARQPPRPDRLLRFQVQVLGQCRVVTFYKRPGVQEAVFERVFLIF